MISKENSTKFLFVGDLPTNEDRASALSGQEQAVWDKLLHHAGIAPIECTYVTSWRGKLPPYIKSNPEVDALKDTLWPAIRARNPSIIIPMGAHANYLVSGDQEIKDARGYLTEVNGFKVLPTIHPRTILTDYSWRFPVLYDLRKAKTYGSQNRIVRPHRNVYIVEKLDDIRQIHESLRPARCVTVDIETHMDLQQISTISFSPSLSEAYVIPILRKVPKGQDRSVWSEAEEAVVLAWITKILAVRRQHIFHNALFDCSHLANNDIYVTGVEDTMLMAHSQQPEQLKSLGFLASLATVERQWKKMRTRNKDEEKNEE